MLSMANSVILKQGVVHLNHSIHNKVASRAFRYII